MACSIVILPIAPTLSSQPVDSETDTRQFRGRHGFDVGRETLGACRGTDHLVNPAVTLIVANDDNYALAA